MLDNPLFRALALLMAVIMAVSPLFKAAIPEESTKVEACNNTQDDNSLCTKLRKLINVDIWRRRKYVIWALVLPIALFGYFVPYVHMVID